MKENNKCCVETKSNKGNGLLSGILYGLLPHSFCLAFAFFSVIGAITATAFLKNVLLIPNIFLYLVIISLILATVSIYFYLQKTDCLCKSGIKSKWKYISTIYTSTIIINLVFFYGVIPMLANINSKTQLSQKGLSEVSLKVNIPCTGHSFLIIQELRKCAGVDDVTFNVPNVFDVTYNKNNTSPQKIAAAEIFKTYPVTIQ